MGNRYKLEFKRLSNLENGIQNINTSLGENVIQISSFGAIGDGVTNDYSAFNALKSAYPTDKITVQLNKIYRIGTSINIPSNIELVGIKDAKIIPDSGIGFNASNIKNVEIVTPLHGYQLNATDSNIKIKNNNITATNYGVLFNGSAIGKNADIIENTITADADAIEINTTGGNFSQVKVIGNTLNAVGTGGSTSSGFAVGIAKGKDIVVSNNIIEHSRQEAIHIEDVQERIVVKGNVLKGCYQDGVKLLNKDNAKPVIISGNQIKKDDTNLLTNSGVSVVYDVNGTLSDNVITDNIIDGFNYGLNFDGYGNQNANGNTIINCNAAIRNLSNKVTGKTICKNCPTLLMGGSGSITDKILSTSEPTTILNYIGTSGYVGATLKGFNFSKPSVLSIVGTNTKILFALPTRMVGNLSLVFSGSTNYFKMFCEIFYDGTDLIIGKTYTVLNGVIASLSLVIDSGNLVLSYYTAAQINVSCNIDFEGDFYQS